jgi:hypothetical protein
MELCRFRSPAFPKNAGDLKLWNCVDSDPRHFLKMPGDLAACKCIEDDPITFTAIKNLNIVENYPGRSSLVW